MFRSVAAEPACIAISAYRRGRTCGPAPRGALRKPLLKKAWHGPETRLHRYKRGGKYAEA